MPRGNTPQTYIASNVPNTIDTWSLLDWLRREFRSVMLGIEASVGGTVKTAFANMYSSTSQSIANITVGNWFDITNFPNTTVTPVGIQVNKTTGVLTIEAPGNYVVAINLSLRHNELNSGRTVQLRPYNITTSTPLNNLTFGTARDTDTTNLTATFMINVAIAGVQVKLQIGNPDTVYTTCSFLQKGISLWSISA